MTTAVLHLLIVFIALILLPLALGFLYVVLILLVELIFCLFWPWAVFFALIGVFTPYMEWYLYRGVSIPVYFGFLGRGSESWKSCWKSFDRIPKMIQMKQEGW